MVNLDKYYGPSHFKREDEDEYEEQKNWVHLFPFTVKHQKQKNIQRTQIPLRLSSAMTGHKVQGLSLYNGVVVHYPTKEESKYMNPMTIWGLNYCILTRVPDISKIAFINLPDYENHMKLFKTKIKGKDHFTNFRNFDKNANLEFASFVKLSKAKI